MILRKILFIGIGLVLVHLATAQVEGLWLVEKMSMGEESMTPVARWARFNPDGTQQSGNGWLQHSIGTYTYVKKDGTLDVVNTNGIDDPAPPFQVTFSGDRMQWQREEDGMDVVVDLVRIQELPMSPGNELMGLWDLDKVEVGGSDMTSKHDPKGTRNLYIGWDKRFTIRNAPEGNRYGVWRVHGHKSELEQTFFGDDCIRKYWDFEINNNVLVLKSVNEETPITMTYHRISQFPE